MADTLAPILRAILAERGLALIDAERHARLEAVAEAAAAYAGGYRHSNMAGEGGVDRWRALLAALAALDGAGAGLGTAGEEG